MPKISVIVPVYKVEEYLQRCVNSILSQTYEDFELILVDDGSPDGCPAMCDEIAKTDDRVRVIHKKNGGLSDARNAGLDYIMVHSDSEWVTFIDSDDWIHPRYLEILHRGVEDGKAKIGISEFVRVSEPSEMRCTDPFEFKLWKTEEYFVSHHLNANIACAKLYPKSAFSDVRYPVGKIHEDEYTTYKLLFEYDTVAAVVEPMYYYYVNPSGIMGSTGNDQNMDRVTALEERVHYFASKPFEKAYQVSIESCITIIAKKLNTPPVSEAYSSQMIKLMKKKLQDMEDDHVSKLSEQGREQAMRLIKQARGEFRSHVFHRFLVRCIGKKRYSRIKERLQHG